MTAVLVHHIPAFDPTDRARCEKLLRIERHLVPPALNNADETELARMFACGELHDCAIDFVRGRVFLGRN